MEGTRRQEEDLIIVSAVEGYALRHRMSTSEVLRFFSQNGVIELLRSQYDVLHTLDLDESLEFAEAFLGGVSA